jgi:pyrrolysyl-tRNA synthetase-like protein
MARYQKRLGLFKLIDKIKLWPSRRGIMHGIRSINISGDIAHVTTHCNKNFTTKNSKNSKAARWLRNKWFTEICPQCRVPDWKMEKYLATQFTKNQGSWLNNAVDSPMSKPLVEKPERLS